MKLENSFEVPASKDEAWELLNDMPRVIPCMPGATLTETVDEDHWKALLAVKLGPIAMHFKTDIERGETDPDAQHARLIARAREGHGLGGGQATIDMSLTPQESGTHVDVVTDIAMSGAVAQYGRGVIGHVATQMIQGFGECLAASLREQG